MRLDAYPESRLFAVAVETRALALSVKCESSTLTLQRLRRKLRWALSKAERWKTALLKTGCGPLKNPVGFVVGEHMEPPATCVSYLLKEEEEGEGDAETLKNHSITPK